MTEGFEIFPQNVAKDGTLIIIKKGLKLYNITDVVDLLNELAEEKEMWKRECERLKGLYYLKNEKTDEHLAWKRVDMND